MNFRFFGFGLLLFALFNSCFLKPTPRNGIYLIPQGYIGEVIIVFNQPDGITPGVENGFYVYKIPENGILKLKTPGVAGIVELSYFYVDKDNKRQSMKYVRNTGDTTISGEPKEKFDSITRDEYENAVFIMNVGGLGSFNTKKGVIQYTSFIIGKPKDSERLYDNMRKRVSSLHREFMN